jgi:hypothetical protein
MPGKDAVAIAASVARARDTGVPNGENASLGEDEPVVLDALQLVRIQSTHRGFLYQHVYAVCCFLAGPSTGVTRVRIERDEDIEVVGSLGVVYVQVKTRSEQLVPSDVPGLLTHFDALRGAHTSGKREGVPRFALVANAELGPELSKTVWPADVLILTPTTPASRIADTGLVVPPWTLDELFQQAAEIAESYRMSALRPASLVAKLVATVARAATGKGPIRSLLVSQLSELCELVAVQLRPLPVIERYRAQTEEPMVPEHGKGLIVVGHAGDGKSAWASQFAAYCPDVAVYLPCSSAPGELVATRLLDAALAAAIVRAHIPAHELALPGRTGLDALSLVDHALSCRGVLITAIIDDCHHARTDHLIATIKAAPSFRWILLGRPSPVLDETAALLQMPKVKLGGWGDDDVAALLADAGCSTRAVEVAELRRATSGAPLFVLHAIEAVRSCGGDTGRYARDLMAGRAPERTAQEAVFDGAVASLPEAEGRVGSALASIDVSLSTDEWIGLLTDAIEVGELSARRALKTLEASGIVVRTMGEGVFMHDAFRPLLSERFLGQEETQRVRETAATFLRDQLLSKRASERIVAFIRILATLGRLSELTDVASALSEWIRETGTISEVRGHLEAALSAGLQNPEERFWALDTLAFFDIEEGETERAAARLPELEALSRHLPDLEGPLTHKRMLVALGRADVESARALAARGSANPTYDRILRYHAALVEGAAGNIAKAVEELKRIGREHLEKLGLSERQVFAANPPALLALMGDHADLADMRHFADCNSAIVSLARAHPEFVAEGAIRAHWAMKFYGMAGAHRSALKAGQDVVDNMLTVMGDPDGAKRFIEETVLPAALEVRLPDMLIPIRSQYAVVCAHCGDFESAAREMKLLASYVGGLTPAGRSELENQQTLIEMIRAQGSPFGDAATRRRRTELQIQRAEQLRELLRPGAQKPMPGRKVRRNEPCPCGSNAKYKKCCGRT